MLNHPEIFKTGKMEEWNYAEISKFIHEIRGKSNNLG